MTDCLRCDRPSPDTGYVCHACAAGLAMALLRAAQLSDQVMVTVARLDRHGGGGRSSAEVPLAFAWDAADASWAVRNTLGTWARIIHEEHAAELPNRPGRLTIEELPYGFIGPPRATRHWVPDRRPASVLVWLARHVGWLRMQHFADEALDELHDAVRLMWRTVDSPPVLWYAGACWTPDEEGTRCAADLYARTEATVVRCYQCGAEHDAAARKAWLLGEVAEVHGGAALIGTALGALGMEVSSATLRKWAERGHIAAAEFDARGRPLYRVGDVVELARRLVQTGYLTAA